MAISKIKTGSITDDAVTAAKVDDDGTGYTVGDLTSTGAITLGSGGTNWTLPTARGTDKYVLQISTSGAATWEESLTAPELASVSNMKINQYETPYSYTGTTTASSTTISSLSSDTGVLVGQYISGSGIPANTTIASITNSTTIVISNAATASASGVALSIQKTPGEKNGGSVTIAGTNYGTVVGDITVSITDSAGTIIANASFLTSLSGGTSITAEWLGTEGTYNEHLNSAHGSYIGDSGNIYLKMIKAGLASNVLNSSTTLTADPTLPATHIIQTGGDTVATAPSASSLGVYGSGLIAGGGQNNNTTALFNFDRNGSTDAEDSSNIDIGSHKIAFSGSAKIRSSPFGDGKSAMYFDGSNDKSTAPYSTDFNFDSASSSWTIEFWANNLGGQSNYGLVTYWASSARCWSVQYGDASSTVLGLANGNGSSSQGTTVASTISAADIGTNEWHHYAIVNDGTNIKFYLDGVAKGSGSSVVCGGSGHTGATLEIGTWSAGAGAFNGYLDEIRIVKGTAVYTGDFTVPTSRLSTTQSSGTNIAAITGTATKLLIHSNQSPTDTSDSKHELKFYEVLQKSNTTARSGTAATAWGSSAFHFGNANASYISTPDSADWDLGSGAWTIEAWVYHDSSSSATPSMGILGARSLGGTVGGWELKYQPSADKIIYFDTDIGSEILTFSNCGLDDTWKHIALSKSTAGSNNLKLFINGVHKETATHGATINRNGSYQGLSVGAECNFTTNNFWLGYIDDIRITVGLCVYPDAFTAPTGPLTKTWSANPFGGSNTAANSTASNVKFLLRSTEGTNATGIVDSSSTGHTVTPTGSIHQTAFGHGGIAPAISWPNNGKKYASCGVYFDGDRNDNGDRINISPAPYHMYTAGKDTTIEFWFYYIKNAGSYRQTLFRTPSLDKGSIGKNFALELNNLNLNAWLLDDGSYQYDSGGVRSTYHVTNFQTTYGPGIWWHFAFTHTGWTGSSGGNTVGTHGVARMYMNGKYVVPTEGESFAQAWRGRFMNEVGNDLCFGGGVDGNTDIGSLNGYIDQIRISDSIRYTGTDTSAYWANTGFSAGGPSKVYGFLGEKNPDVGTITLSATSTSSLDFSSVGTALPAGLTLAEGTDDGNTRKGTITGSFTGTVNTNTSTQNILIKAQDPSDATRAITFNGTTGMGITQNATGSNTLFEARRYIGTEVARDITGFGFQPDLLWIKNRGVVNNHFIVDSVRGAGKRIQSNSTVSEGSQDLTLHSEFNSDGYGLGSSTSNNANSNNNKYIAWGWKAGGAPSAAGKTIADGVESTISSSATFNASADMYDTDHFAANGVMRSVNTTGKFSITKITNPSSAIANRAVPHGLGGIPDFVMIKPLDTAGWICYHSSLTSNTTLNNKLLNLHANGAEGALPGSTSAATNYHVYTPDDSGWDANEANISVIMYAWKAVSGVSAFGTYTGVSGGVTQTLDFRPRWIMTKSFSNNSSYTSWAIYDAFRAGPGIWSWGSSGTKTLTAPHNVIYADQSKVEGQRAGASGVPTASLIIYDDGFKFFEGNDETNSHAGWKYAYAAFA